MKRDVSFGENGLSLVDRFGTWLSCRAIVSQFRGKQNLEVLEIGCGYHANNLKKISLHAKGLTGLDLNISDEISSMPNFRRIEGRYEDNLSLLRDRKYDVIMIISVLEHLDNPVMVLKECREMLAKEAILLVNVPTWLGKYFLELSAFKLGLSPRLEMDDHKMYYDKKDLWRALIQAGFLPSGISMKYHKFGLNLFASVKK
ncbi:class I SAM-dependent methyltransferase [bacterium]|nr:class I SAM-dependent methyltransferase [bacterium]